MDLRNQHIVLATHNAGKVPEITVLVKPYGCTVSTATEYSVSEPVEDGDTFEENALIKARHTASVTGKIALADDSGLCVDILGGRPGIHSARYAGADKDFTKACKKLESELVGVENPTAYFVCALAIVMPNGTEKVFRGEVHGILTFPMRGVNGFGYDPIFIPNGYDSTFGEMNPSDKHSMSHRQNAFDKMVVACFSGVKK